MIYKTILVIPDQHAHPDFNNDRAIWLGNFITDIKPDIVVNLGDCADMPSLSSYDKGKASFYGNSYERDIQSHLDFQTKLWEPTKKSKKKQPYKVVIHGNHENRIKKVLEYEPHLSGDSYGVSFKDFEFEKFYNEVIPYDGSCPGIFTCEDITFSHFLPSGGMGRPISGEHHASNLIQKNYHSSVVGHSHIADYAVRTKSNGNKIMGLVCGVYQDYKSPWAGQSQNNWWKGCVVLREVSKGYFDPEFVSLSYLKRVYSV